MQKKFFNIIIENFFLEILNNPRPFLGSFLFNFIIFIYFHFKFSIIYEWHLNWWTNINKMVTGHFPESHFPEWPALELVWPALKLVRAIRANGIREIVRHRNKIHLF